MPVQGQAPPRGCRPEHVHVCLSCRGTRPHGRGCLTPPGPAGGLLAFALTLEPHAPYARATRWRTTPPACDSE